MEYVKLGKNIRKYRNMRGMSQDDLGEKVGCCTSHIGMIKNGHTKPSLEILVRIANALNVTPDMLLIDSLEAPQLVYLREMEQRIEKYPIATKIIACDAIDGILKIIEQLYDT